MSILGPKCGIDGCKKGKLRPHTHVIGDISRSGADRQLIAKYAEFAKMRGESVAIPGGSADDMNMFMKKRLKDGEKEAKKFREELRKKKR